MPESEDCTIVEQAQNWIVRLSSGDMSADEMTAFRSWLARSDAHERTFAEERYFWCRLSGLEDTFERLDAEEDDQVAGVPMPGPIWRRRRKLRASFPPRKSVRRYATVLCLAVAACLLLSVFAPHLVTVLRADYYNGGGQTMAVTLPDGSRAVLNRNSAIRVDFGETVRRVELLDGEVYVEVRPNPARPFRVVAGHGASEAVGTAYAVRKADRGTRVAVTEGRVVVTGAGEPGAAVSLRAGEGIRYADGRFLGRKFTVNGEDALAWRNGKIVLVNRSLSTALAELERYHHGRILLLGGAQAYQPVSGVIDLERLEDGIAALAATHGLTVTRVTPYLTVVR